MPTKENDKRKKLIIEAEEIIRKIPTMNDQIGRMEVISEASINIDQPLARKILKNSMGIAIKGDSSDFYSAQRRIIDLSYKIDPDLAASLASSVDDDPARIQTKINLQRQIEIQKLRKLFAEETNTDDFSEKNEKEDEYSKAAWMLLGSLKAGRINPLHMENTRKFSLIASDIELNKSYPIFAWVIENAVEMYKNTDQAAQYLRPIFEAVISGCEMIAPISKKTYSQIKIGNIEYTDNSQIISVVINIDEQDKAREILSNWLKDNISEYLIIADPYFSLDDIWILQQVKKTASINSVQILLSRESLEKSLGKSHYDEVFREKWKIEISDQEPPNTEIIIIGIEPTGKSPIHDRWWISKGSGLRIGTSVNGLGTRISEISYLNRFESEEREMIIDRYISKKERIIDGNKISYSTFTL